MKLKNENNCQPILNFFAGHCLNNIHDIQNVNNFCDFPRMAISKFSFPCFPVVKSYWLLGEIYLHKKLKLKSCQISVQLQKVFSINGDRKYKKYFINSWLVSIVQPFQTGNLFRHQYQLDTRYQRVFENNSVFHSF